MRIAVLMTCFNRKEMTLEALESLFSQKQVEDLDVSRALVNRQQTSLRNRESFDRSEEDMLTRRLVRIVFACADEKVFSRLQLRFRNRDRYI